MTTVTDSFTGTGELGASWQSGGVGHGYVKSSDQCVYRSGAAGVTYTAASFSAGSTQFAQVKMVRIAATDYTPGPAIRCATSSGIASLSSGYAASVFSNGMIRLQRGTSGGILKNSSAGAISNGQTLRLADEGSGNIRVYVDNVLVTSGDFATQYTDASPHTGYYIGMYSYALSGTGLTYIIDDFSGGDGTGAGASAVKGRSLLLGVG